MTRRPALDLANHPGARSLGINLDALGRWQIPIPIHFTSLNKLMRMHWAKRGRTLDDEAAVTLWCCDLARVPRATGKRRVTQRITLVGRDRRRDNDNAWKSVLDSLVKSGRLIDDGPDYVETMPIEHERGTERKTTIIIEDID